MTEQTPESVDADSAVETEKTTNDLAEQEGEVWVDEDQSPEPQEDFGGAFDPDEDEVAAEPIDGAGIDADQDEDDDEPTGGVQ